MDLQKETARIMDELAIAEKEYEQEKKRETRADGEAPQGCRAKKAHGGYGGCVMTPQTAQFIDKDGSYWRICPTTRHYEKCVSGVWIQSDSADDLYPLDEAEPNGYTEIISAEYTAF